MQKAEIIFLILIQPLHNPCITPIASILFSITPIQPLYSSYGPPELFPLDAFSRRQVASGNKFMAPGIGI